jgi:hypothetical protein
VRPGLDLLNGQKKLARGKWVEQTFEYSRGNDPKQCTGIHQAFTVHRMPISDSQSFGSASTMGRTQESCATTIT